MVNIHKIRWKKKKIDQRLQLTLVSSWNDTILVFMDQSKKFSIKILEECIQEIYSIVFQGASFPFEEEVL